MIKKIAWETFKNTGDINTYLELKQIETLEDKLEGNLQEKLGNTIEKQINPQNMQENIEKTEGKEGL